jgi:hypothetical protein
LTGPNHSFQINHSYWRKIMKKKILIVLVLVASVAMLATGAFAYFSSTTNNTGNINSGTLTLGVASGASNDCSSYSFGTATTVWSMTNMAPGDTLDGYLCMKNFGSIAANQVTFEWVYEDALRPLADRIFLIDVRDSTDPGNVIAQFIAMGDGKYPGMAADGKISFTELAWLSNNYGYPFDAVSGGTPFLGPGVSRWLYMKFEFDPAAGNEFQGLVLDYDLNVIARQQNVFP